MDAASRNGADLSLSERRRRARAGGGDPADLPAPGHLPAWQWAAVRQGASAVLLGLAGEIELPAEWEAPRWIIGLQRYTMALELHWQCTVPVEATARVAALATARAAAAWDLAANISERTPSEEAVVAVAEALERIAAAAADDASLGRVAALAEAIAGMIREMRGRGQVRAGA